MGSAILILISISAVILSIGMILGKKFDKEFLSISTLVLIIIFHLIIYLDPKIIFPYPNIDTSIIPNINTEPSVLMPGDTFLLLCSPYNGYDEYLHSIEFSNFKLIYADSTTKEYQDLEYETDALPVPIPDTIVDKESFYNQDKYVKIIMMLPKDKNLTNTKLEFDVNINYFYSHIIQDGRNFMNGIRYEVLEKNTKETKSIYIGSSSLENQANELNEYEKDYNFVKFLNIIVCIIMLIIGWNVARDLHG